MNSKLRFSIFPRAVSAPRWLAASLWLLTGLSASYWSLRGWGNAEQAILPAPTAERITADREAVARGLGAVEPSSDAIDMGADATSPHELLGVVRTVGGRGAALIASDGQPPRAYRIGAELPDGLVLRELTPREALLGPAQGDITLRLSLPVKP